MANYNQKLKSFALNSLENENFEYIFIYQMTQMVIEKLYFIVKF